MKKRAMLRIDEFVPIPKELIERMIRIRELAEINRKRDRERQA